MEGLAQQQVVVANVDSLVRSSGRWTEDPGEGLGFKLKVANPLYEDHSGIQTRSIRLDCFKFDVDDPNGWIYQANQFFSYHQTNLHHHILLTSFHMEGKALVSFKILRHREVLLVTNQIKTNLQSVEACKTKFETLSN